MHFSKNNNFASMELFFIIIYVFFVVNSKKTMCRVSARRLSIYNFAWGICRLNPKS
jgi:hypothetical protein